MRGVRVRSGLSVEMFSFEKVLDVLFIFDIGLPDFLQTNKIINGGNSE